MRNCMDAVALSSCRHLVPKVAHNEIPFDLTRCSPETAPSHRRRSLRVLFIHDDAETVDRCLREFKKAQFAVRADFVTTPEQCAERLHSKSYDLVVAGYPSLHWKGAQALQFLRQTVQDIPILFLTNAAGSELVTKLAPHGAFDWVEREHISQLPMAVRRILNEKKLRAELEVAGKALRHSQSMYRALADNPAYGICRCDARGKLLDVNQALLTMLGYENKEELLVADWAPEIIIDLCHGTPSPGCSPEQVRIEPVEIEWKRKNGTTLKALLSGRGVFGEGRHFDGYELIAFDVTKQRALEERLRHQAFSDSLTGLANYGRLFEVLQAEVHRTQRTEREFSLVLLDLDGLKKINDRFGHLVGSRALCRLAQILVDSCRSVDTAARQGGDEFALVLPETGQAAAKLVARRICELVSKDGEKPTLSVSVGVASYPADADTVATLLHAADKALYAMKDKQPRASRARPSSIRDISDLKRKGFNG